MKYIISVPIDACVDVEVEVENFEEAKQNVKTPPITASGGIFPI